MRADPVSKGALVWDSKDTYQEEESAKQWQGSRFQGTTYALLSERKSVKRLAHNHLKQLARSE